MPRLEYVRVRSTESAGGDAERRDDDGERSVEGGVGVESVSVDILIEAESTVGGIEEGDARPDEVRSSAFDEVSARRGSESAAGVVEARPTPEGRCWVANQDQEHDGKPSGGTPVRPCEVDAEGAREKKRRENEAVEPRETGRSRNGASSLVEPGVQDVGPSTTTDKEDDDRAAPLTVAVNREEIAIERRSAGSEDCGGCIERRDAGQDKGLVVHEPRANDALRANDNQQKNKVNGGNAKRKRMNHSLNSNLATIVAGDTHFEEETTSSKDWWFQATQKRQNTARFRVAEHELETECLKTSGLERVKYEKPARDEDHYETGLRRGRMRRRLARYEGEQEANKNLRLDGIICKSEHIGKNICEGTGAVQNNLFQQLEYNRDELRDQQQFRNELLMQFQWKMMANQQMHYQMQLLMQGQLA
ncbi:hypothetical protein ACHAWF_014645, partial [Thalassiosira exigua]